MNAQLAKVADLIYLPEDEPECPHDHVDCYADDGSEEYVGWHCVDCGEPVPAPTVDIPVIDDLPH